MPGLFDVPTGTYDIFGGRPSAVGFQNQFLDALRSRRDPLQSDAFKAIQQLLQPGASGMSANLDALYGIGSTKINQSTSSNVAGAQTGAQAKGLQGSSIELADVATQQRIGEEAKASLLASLLGQQQQASGQLANLTFQGGIQSEQDSMMALLKFLMEGGESSANLGMFDEMMGRQQKLSSQQGWMGLGSAGIGGLAKILGPILLASMTGGAGAAVGAGAQAGIGGAKLMAGHFGDD